MKLNGLKNSLCLQWKGKLRRRPIVQINEQIKHTLITSNKVRNPNWWQNALNRQMQFILIIVHNNALSHKLFLKISRENIRSFLNKRKSFPSALTSIIVAALLFHVYKKCTKRMVVRIMLHSYRSFRYITAKYMKYILVALSSTIRYPHWIEQPKKRREEEAKTTNESSILPTQPNWTI